MGADGRGRAALLRAMGFFLLVFALGKFAALGLVSKGIRWRRGGPPEIAINWEGFFLLSAIGIVVAAWCAYHTWRGWMAPPPRRIRPDRRGGTSSPPCPQPTSPSRGADRASGTKLGPLAVHPAPCRDGGAPIRWDNSARRSIRAPSYGMLCRVNVANVRTRRRVGGDAGAARCREREGWDAPAGRL